MDYEKDIVTTLKTIIFVHEVVFLFIANLNVSMLLHGKVDNLFS